MHDECSEREPWQDAAHDVISELGMHVPNMALVNVRHNGMRDLAKWASRMQVERC